MRFIHTADIHLDSPIKGLEIPEDDPSAEIIKTATRLAFDNLLDLAFEEEVDFILIAGDLYDGDWKDYNTGLFFVNRIGRLAAAGIRVFIVSGNHDAASQITKTMPLPENVTLFSSRKPQSVPLNEFDVLVHGQSYPTRAVTGNLAAQYPQYDANFFNIGLLHTSLTGREDHENYAPCRIDELKSKGYDYWALGHVHKREIVSRDPWIIFPGNVQGRHIKETGVKGATLVTVENRRITKVEERELDVLRWSNCSVDLSTCETRESIYGRVRSAMEKEQSLADGRPLALRLLLKGSCPLHAELHSRTANWTEEFRGLAAGIGDIWLEKVKFKTTPKASIDKILDEDSPLTGLLHSINSMEFGYDSLTALVPELALLKTKLPAELLDKGSLFDASVKELNEIREEVKDMLIARLLQHRGDA